MMNVRFWLILFGLTLFLNGCRHRNGETAVSLPVVQVGTQESTSPMSVTENTGESPGSTSLLGSHDGAEKLLTQSACRAYGWLIDLSDPERDVQVRVLADGVEVAQAVADLYRPDLDLNDMCPGGTCAYAVDLWGLISINEEHTILVQALDVTQNRWVDLRGSPKTVMCIQQADSVQTPGKAWSRSIPQGG
jgi:hypothetical protein